MFPPLIALCSGWGKHPASTADPALRQQCPRCYADLRNASYLSSSAVASG